MATSTPSKLISLRPTRRLRLRQRWHFGVPARSLTFLSLQHAFIGDWQWRHADRPAQVVRLDKRSTAAADLTQ